MADNGLTVKGDPEHFDYLFDAVRNLRPEEYQRIVQAAKTAGTAPIATAPSSLKPMASMASPMAAPTQTVAPLNRGILGGLAGPPTPPADTGLPAVRPLARFASDTISTPMVSEPAAPPAAPSSGHGILGKIGSALGTAFLPNLMPEIPGTRQYQEREEEREADLGKKRAETGLEGAQAGEAGARTKAIPIQAAAEQTQAETADFKAHHPEATEAQIKQHAIYAWMARPENAGKDAADAEAFLTGLTKTVPEAQQPLGERVPNINKALESRYQVLNPGKPLPPELTLPANATQKDFDNIDKLMQQNEGAAGTQAQRQLAEEARKNTLQMAQQGMELRRETLEGTQAQRETTNKEKVLTYYDPVFSADDRLKLMEGSLPAALKGDQQAMLNIVANHVNMTMGVPRGKVGRVPQTLFQEAEKSAPYLQRIGAKFDKDGYLSGVTLTSKQMKSMIELGKQTLAQEKASADSKLDYLGIPPEERPQIQSKSAGGAAPTPQTHSVSISAAMKANPGATRQQIEAAAKAKGFTTVP